MNTDVVREIKSYLICGVPGCEKFVEDYDKYEVESWCLGSFDVDVLGELFFELYVNIRRFISAYGVFRQRGQNPYFLLNGGLVKGCVEFRGISIDIDLYGDGKTGCRECCLDEIELLYGYIRNKCNLFMLEMDYVENTSETEDESEWEGSDTEPDSEPDSEASVEML